MKKFDNLPEAAEYAATLCGRFRFSTSDERYDVKELLALAEISDSENPIDEDDFYGVSPSGAIGLCMYGGEIDRLFLSEAAP
jgi:hypothetical protein